jgi:trans-L-3-hydroxyproline dehydratase
LLILKYFKVIIISQSLNNSTDLNIILQQSNFFYILQVDRSPCGSGVTARIAQQYTRNLIKIGQSRTFEGPTGAKFQAKPEKEIKYGDYNAVVVEVSGNGYYSGTSTFTLEEDDEIGRGFLLN